MKLLSFLLLPLTITSFPTKRPQSCQEVEQDVRLPSRVYTIYPAHFGLGGVKVFCDFETDFDADKGAWTVFLRRDGGKVNFYQPWESYRNGFGDPAEEHWIGLELLHYLTQNGSYVLRVVLDDFDGDTAYAQYDSFHIDAESDGYALHVSGFYDGGAGDSLTYHHGQNFSTFDNDQDNSMSNCAQRFHGAFWYNACYHTNPTGLYQWEHETNHYSNGVIWSKWKGYGYSVKRITMMFRPS